jgi:hypothetical protein
MPINELMRGMGSIRRLKINPIIIPGMVIMSGIILCSRSITVTMIREERRMA